MWHAGTDRMVPPSPAAIGEWDDPAVEDYVNCMIRVFYNRLILSANALGRKLGHCRLNGGGDDRGRPDFARAVGPCRLRKEIPCVVCLSLFGSQ